MKIRVPVITLFTALGLALFQPLRASTTVATDTTQDGGTFPVTPPTLLITDPVNDPKLTLTNGAIAAWTGPIVVGSLTGESGHLELLNGSEMMSLGDGEDWIATYGGTEVYEGYRYLGLNTGSTGTALVSGVGSLWTSGHWTGQLYVGFHGTGILDIEDSGKVQVNGHAFIGAYTDSHGEVTVTGSGSELEINNGHRSGQDGGPYVPVFFIGLMGQGVLNIENGGNVIAPTVYLGHQIDGQGEVNVSGSDTHWNGTTEIYVGTRNRGVLNITDGAKVTTVDTYLGYWSDSLPEHGQGEITVSGEGSHWTNTDNFRIGYHGEGKVTISNGATVSTAFAYLGYDSTGHAEVTVDGAGSHWENTNNLRVGDSGTGALAISDGATVSIGGNTYLGYSGSGSQGEVTVDGEGTRWENTGYLRIGDVGTGALAISDGATVSVGGNAYLAYSNHSHGTATVNGEGSLWEIDGELIVGRQSDQDSPATLHIENGGRVTSGDAYVGYQVPGLPAYGFGEASVTGEGSHWDINGNLAVGDLVELGGLGRLTIGSGSTVDVQGRLTTTTGSTVTLDGGILSVGSVYEGPVWLLGGEFHFNSGTLQLGDNRIIGTDQTVNWVFGANPEISGGQKFVIEGLADLNGNLTVNGGVFESNAFVNGTGGHTQKVFSVQNGGTAHTAGTTVLGETAGTSGEATVSGEGSRWDIGGILSVGLSGEGRLDIADGGVVEVAGATGIATIGFAQDSRGEIHVVGEDSRLVSLSLTVGSAGTGLLNIENGGNVASSEAFVGSLDGGHGSVVIKGTDSLWTVSEGLTLGNGGTGVGEVTIESGGTLTVGEDLRVRAGSTLKLEGGSLSTGDLDITAGTFDFSGGKLAVHGTVHGNLGVSEAGEFTGAATVTGSLYNAGIVAPGNSPGTLTVEGDYSQAFSGTLVMELGGGEDGQYDVLVVNGLLSLDGTLEIVSWEGFMPTLGDSFQLFTFNNISGNFHLITAFQLGGGLQWDYSLLESEGRLTVVPEPSTWLLLALGAGALLLARRRVQASR